MDELSQRIQAGACRQFGREIAGQFGIHQRDFRQHQRAAETHFHTMLRRGKHGVPRDFRAGAGSRGNRDDRHGRVGQRLGATDDFEIIKNFASVRRQGGDGLGGVNRAAAAEADDEVASFAASEFDSAFDVFDLWLTGDRERPPGDSLLSEQAIQSGRPAGGTACQNQGPTPEVLRNRPDLAKGARPENDSGGSSEFKAHHWLTSRHRREKRC